MRRKSPSSLPTPAPQRQPTTVTQSPEGGPSGPPSPLRSPAGSAEADQPDLAPALVLHRSNGAERPVAAWFPSADTERAIRAAGLMNLKVVTLTDDGQRTAAGTLPRGHLHVTKRAHVAAISHDLYDRVLIALGLAPDDDGDGGPASRLRNEPDVPAPPADPDGADTAIEAAREPRDEPQGDDARAVVAAAPDPWAAVRVGSLVLATTGPMEGWFECLITHSRANDRFVLRWRDWPKEPEISRHRHELALVHPATDPRG